MTLTAFYGPLPYFVTALCPPPWPPGPPSLLNSARVMSSVSHGPRLGTHLPAGSLLWFVPSSSRISLDDGQTPIWASTRGLANLVGRYLILRPASSPPLSLSFCLLNGLLSGLPRFLPLQASKMPYHHGNLPRL